MIKTTEHSPIYDIMGYEYHCGDISARVPEFLPVEYSDPITIRGWRALADDIRAGDNAVPGAPRRVGPIVAKRSVRWRSHH